MVAPCVQIPPSDRTVDFIEHYSGASMALACPMTGNTTPGEPHVSFPFHNPETMVTSYMLKYEKRYANN